MTGKYFFKQLVLYFMLPSGDREGDGVEGRAYPFGLLRLVVPIVPALAVLFDYTVTLLISGGGTVLLHYEWSPLVRFAAANQVLGLYVFGMMILYYVLSSLVLRLLDGTPYFGPAVLLILMISGIHLMGGLSWYVQTPLFSTAVHVLSVVAILAAIAVFIGALFKKGSVS